MARVTVEDCVIKVPNRFELVLLAAQRAREITSGAPLSIDRDDDKNPVVALREIADETVGLSHLRESVVRGMQKHVELDEAEESHELEVDTSVFGFSTAGVLGGSEARGRGYEDADIDDGADVDDETDVDDEAELDEDELPIDEELADEDEDLKVKLDSDVLSSEDEADDGDLADLPEPDLPGDEDEL